jgi:2-haloacid dehalogenase
MGPGASATPPGVTRRAAAALPVAALAPPARGVPGGPVAALAFDAFAIFDPRPVLAHAAALSPDRPGVLRDLWFQKLFAYTWLRTAAERYAPFDVVAAEALDFAIRALDLQIPAADRAALLAGLSALPVWADVPARLEPWRRRGLRLALLSNMTEAMLLANLRRNWLEAQFESVLSTDRARAFKPAPIAYRLAVRRLGLPSARIGFAAFAAWDAAGASWFGFPTAWINRTGQPAEGVAAPAVLAGPDLATIERLLAPDR